MERVGNMALILFDLALFMCFWGMMLYCLVEG